MRSRPIKKTQSLRQNTKQSQNNEKEIRDEFLAISSIPHKNQMMHDVVSVIEEVGDSFVSSDDFLKQFEQYGIKIQNVGIDGDSIDRKLKIGQSTFSNQQVFGRKNYQYGDVFDDSNIEKMKQKQFADGELKIQKTECRNKLKPIVSELKKLKELFSLRKEQIAGLMKNFYLETWGSFEMTKNKMIQNYISLEQKYKKQKQCFNSLRQAHQSLRMQLQCLHKKNKDLTEEIRGKNINNILVPMDKFNSLGSIDIFEDNRKKGAELQLQYQKQSKILKSLNQQIRQLTQQLSEVQGENKILKTKIKQSEKMMSSSSQNNSTAEQTDRQIQTFSKFLEKIKLLQDEINEMKKKEAREKEDQMEEWKGEIKDQLQQIQQFLAICEHKQKQLDQRQRELNFRQRMLNKEEDNMKKRYSKSPGREGNEELKDYGEESPGVWYGCSKRTTINDKSKPRVSTQPSCYSSERLVKCGTEQHLSKRVVESQRMQWYDKGHGNGNSYLQYRQQPKYSSSWLHGKQELSSRLNRISSCIESELNALGCRH